MFFVMGCGRLVSLAMILYRSNNIRNTLEKF